MERADLAPSVGKQLVCSNGSPDYMMRMPPWLILAVDFLILPVIEFRGYEACMPREGTEMVGRGVSNRSNLVTGSGSIERLGEQGPSPCGGMANSSAGNCGLKICFVFLGTFPKEVTGGRRGGLTTR